MKDEIIEKTKLLNWIKSAPDNLYAEELIKWIENHTQDVKTKTKDCDN